MRGRPTVRLLLLLLAAAAPLAAQVPGRVDFAITQDPTLPIPALTTRTSDADLADQLFLRLGMMRATFRTTGDDAMTPLLASGWRREDPLTLRFTLDPRARWQDGTPVSARDVVFTFGLMTHPVVGSGRIVMEPVASVEAVGERGVRVRFKRPFREQLYLFAFNMQPLPSHLLQGIEPTAIARSDFASGPVGNGPYRYVRRVPGQFVELRADPDFFLGAPGIARVVIRVVPDPSAMLNQLLSGGTDVMADLPAAALPQLRERPQLRVAAFSHNLLLWAGLNHRNPVDTARPHPILADRRVREALRAALDRTTMVRAVFGPTAAAPDAAQSQLWAWVTGGSLPSSPQNVARARALLAEAGWRDGDGDGIVDRNGAPLRLRLIYPSTSGVRHTFAVQAQAMWRAIGVDVQLDRIEQSAFVERRNAGAFDLEIHGVNQDASPSSLTQSWSCAAARDAGSNNKGRWCDPEFDRLVRAAEIAPDPAAAYRLALRRMADEVPAIFLAAPFNQVALHERYVGVEILPVKNWLSLWRWRVRPDAALPRDR